MEVILEEKALSSMLRYAVLWYRREAFGYLHGQKTPENILITDHTDMSRVAKRTTGQIKTVSSAPEIQRRLECIADDYIIGDFHTHNQANGTMPSTGYSDAGEHSDLADMLTRPEYVYLIAAVRDRKRRRRWRTKKNGELSGTADGYDFSLAAYIQNAQLYYTKTIDEGKVTIQTLTPEERQQIFKPVPIYCPEIEGKLFQ